jgi:hypothetical protein
MIRIPVTIPGSIAITVSITLFGVITSLSVAGYTSIVCVRGGRNRDESHQRLGQLASDRTVVEAEPIVMPKVPRTWFGRP